MAYSPSWRILSRFQSASSVPVPPRSWQAMRAFLSRASISAAGKRTSISKSGRTPGPKSSRSSVPGERAYVRPMAIAMSPATTARATDPARAASSSVFQMR